MKSAIVVSLVLLAGAVSAQQPEKISNQLVEQMSAAPSEARTVWLYLDRTARSDVPIALTERAEQRRGRANRSSLLIDERDYPIRTEVLERIRTSGVSIRRGSRWLGAVSVTGTAAQIRRAAAIAEVEKVETVVTLSAPPHPEIERSLPRTKALIDDGLASFQHQFMHADRLHEGGLDGTGVTIAFFDSGFETGHPSFDSTNFLATYDFVQDDSDVTGADCPDQPSSIHQSRHGTLVLGVVAANDPGTMIGLAPKADFVLAKTEITCGFVERKIEEDNWIAAAEWADSIGVDIINSSLAYSMFQDTGSYDQSQLDGNTAAITIAADAAAAKNILVVNSAGNDRLNGWGTIAFPADGDSVIAAGAANPDSTLAGFSSPGPSADGRIKPDISTLGIGVVAPDYASAGYVAANGTSLAAPLVAGGAALALQVDPGFTAADLRGLIRSTGSLAESPNNDLGYGLYNAYAAADRIRFNLRPVISVVSGTTDIPIDYIGRAEGAVSMSLVDSPTGVALVQQGSGFFLQIPVFEESVTLSPVVLVVTDGRFNDTAQVSLLVQAPFAAVTAGPNPFRDTVTFFSPASEPIRSVTIFTSAGEKVWETVNNSTGSVDEMSTTWNGTNADGSRVAANVYIAVIKTSGGARTIKLLKID